MQGTETAKRQHFCMQNCAAPACPACTSLARPRVFQGESGAPPEEPHELDKDEIDLMEMLRFFRGGIEAK